MAGSALRAPGREQEQEEEEERDEDEDEAGGDVAAAFLRLEQELNRLLRELPPPGEPVTHIYRPLDYAWEPHSDFVRRYCRAPKRVLFLGMNPGPFGMAQTGVPFGEVWHVREWLRVRGGVQRPHPEHPKRPVLGLSCRRAEVSGARFWGLIRRLCPEPRLFFRHCFVHNHCPLLFLSASGRNVPPSDLPPPPPPPLAGALRPGAGAGAAGAGRGAGAGAGPLRRAARPQRRGGRGAGGQGGGVAPSLPAEPPRQPRLGGAGRGQAAGAGGARHAGGAGGRGKGKRGRGERRGIAPGQGFRAWGRV
uniref:Single-strand-selective monofunctional uracil-DNA glycosylase 1 n=1 Tax=Strigops habroptila TaxID=2489341 RepID=A0A672UBB8_STRHB